jgi:hypothetical protein
MDLTEGSETSAKLNVTLGKYPKEKKQKNNNISLQPPQKMFSGGCSRKPHRMLFNANSKIH